MSATRWVSGSQLTPYQLWQQSLPVQELKIPKYGSCKAALKANKAALSEGVQQLTQQNMKLRNTNVVMYVKEEEEEEAIAPSFFLSLSLSKTQWVINWNLFLFLFLKKKSKLACGVGKEAFSFFLFWSFVLFVMHVEECGRHYIYRCEVVKWHIYPLTCAVWLWEDKSTCLKIRIRGLILLLKI